MTLTYQRLRAPNDNGQVLHLPPLDRFSATLNENLRVLAEHQFQVWGHSISDLRKQARLETVKAGLKYTSTYRDVTLPATSENTPILMAGHQPTLFHPGVWHKNFVLNAMASEVNALAINLVIDNDHSALRSIRVPVGGKHSPEVKLLKFDSRNTSQPFEMERLFDRSVFESFGQRVQSAINPMVERPLVRRLWPEVVDIVEQLNRPSMSIAAGRHRLEGELGLQTLEVPQSMVCQTNAFACFTSEIFSRAMPFFEAYNRTVREYRSLHRVRSTSHPVPDLKKVDEWVELPFWVWSNKSEVRRGVFVRVVAGKVHVSDLNSIEFSLDIDSLDEQIATLPSMNIALRTRALTTTMYGRLFLSDAFFHGIGGAKYDQLTDQIALNFFGANLPSYHTITGTYQLPSEYSRTTQADVAKLAIQKRNLRFHGEWELQDGDTESNELKRAKQQHLKARPAHGSRKAWQDEMERINQRMFEMLKENDADLDRAINVAMQEARSHKLLGSREFSFCLFPENALPQYLT